MWSYRSAEQHVDRETCRTLRISCGVTVLAQYKLLIMDDTWSLNLQSCVANEFENRHIRCGQFWGRYLAYRLVVRSAFCSASFSTNTSYRRSVYNHAHTETGSEMLTASINFCNVPELFPLSRWDIQWWIELLLRTRVTTQGSGNLSSIRHDCIMLSMKAGWSCLSDQHHGISTPWLVTWQLWTDGMEHRASREEYILTSVGVLVVPFQIADCWYSWQCIDNRWVVLGNGRCWLSSLEISRSKETMEWAIDCMTWLMRMFSDVVIEFRCHCEFRAKVQNSSFSYRMSKTQSQLFVVAYISIPSSRQCWRVLYCNRAWRCSAYIIYRVIRFLGFTPTQNEDSCRYMLSTSAALWLDQAEWPSPFIVSNDIDWMCCYRQLAIVSKNNSAVSQVHWTDNQFRSVICHRSFVKLIVHANDLAHNPGRRAKPDQI